LHGAHNLYYKKIFREKTEMYGMMAMDELNENQRKRKALKGNHNRSASLP
jgi:hypothetical protein